MTALSKVMGRSYAVLCGASPRPSGDVLTPTHDAHMSEGSSESVVVPELLSKCLQQMAGIYRLDPEKAVRSQSFIKLLHKYLGDELTGRLTPWALRRGITVQAEATILGSHKPKEVDIAIIDPQNGPLMCVGVRSQMSSVGKNALTYYEGIIGECISLQDRFPLAIHGYLYLMPQRPIKETKEAEQINHARYARMYAAITGRSGIGYDRIRGVYDQFAYMVVDFDGAEPVIRDDLVRAGAPDVDLSVTTLVDRLVGTFAQRMLFWDVLDVEPRGR